MIKSVSIVNIKMKSFGESTTDITTVNSVNNPQLKQQWWLLTCKTLGIYNFTAEGEKFPCTIYLADYGVFSSLDHGFLMAQSVLIPLPPPPPPKQYLDFFFLDVQSDHGSGKQFLRWMQKKYCGGMWQSKNHIYQSFESTSIKNMPCRNKYLKLSK